MRGLYFWYFAFSLVVMRRDDVIAMSQRASLDRDRWAVFFKTFYKFINISDKMVLFLCCGTGSLEIDNIQKFYLENTTYMQQSFCQLYQMGFYDYLILIRNSSKAVKTSRLLNNFFDDLDVSFFFFAYLQLCSYIRSLFY